MNRLFVLARLFLPLLVAIPMCIATPQGNPMLLILTLVSLGPFAMFLDHGTTALRTHAWFHIETLARIALVCAAAAACRDAAQTGIICLLFLIVMQVITLALMGELPANSRVQSVVGSAIVFESVWLAAYAIGTNPGWLPWKVPPAPLWLLVLGLCLMLAYARENAWRGLTRSRRLSPGQRAVIWPKMLANRTSAQYWNVVFDYFRSLRCSVETPWHTKELAEAVAVAPMDYLVDYIKEQFNDDSTRRYIHAPLCLAMFESIKERMQAIDYRASIAWSMASSSKEAISMFERMRDTTESIDSVELPAL